MLTRQSPSSGAYLACFDTLPKEVLWTRERIEQSFLATMNTRPASQGIWVFGYGSLLWNPVLEFIDQQAATLHGWHRSFCLRMRMRMLALEPGGVTQGQAVFNCTPSVPMKNCCCCGFVKCQRVLIDRSGRM